MFRYAERSESETAAAIREFVTGWLEAVGIGTEVSVYDDTQLTDVIGSGEYDLFVWGWTPFVDPDPMLSYFTCAQVTTEHGRHRLQRRQLVQRGVRRAVRPAERRARPRRSGIELVHQMLELFYHESTYVVLFEDADLQAYRTDRFEGWLRQPAETGPVLFTNSSPTYFNLKPIGGGRAATTAGWAPAALIAHHRRWRRDPRRGCFAGRCARARAATTASRPRS